MDKSAHFGFGADLTLVDTGVLCCHSPGGLKYILCYKPHFIFMISRINKNVLPNYQNPGFPVVGLNYHESFVVSDQVGVHTDDGGVCLSDPGEAVGGELPDLAGQVDCLALPHCQVHHLGLAQPTEVRPLVKP